MMRAGKDYLTTLPEYEDRRSRHLVELCRNIAAQGAPAAAPVMSGIEENAAAAKDDGQAALKLAGQGKPATKLK